jgi:hypothetical protein
VGRGDTVSAFVTVEMSGNDHFIDLEIVLLLVVVTKLQCLRGFEEKHISEIEHTE